MGLANTLTDRLIEVRDLSRSFGSHQAVRNVSFEVKRGEVLGFLGPNGAGKSTTMQMLTGNLAPTAGSVMINGIDMLAEPRRAKAMLGFLPELPPLNANLTVDEYLTFCARLHRIPVKMVNNAVTRVKGRCGLEAVSGRLLGNLSKGFQQRVGIAQAIIHNPAVVILDEPTVGLDPLQIREIRTLIKELGGDHSVILSTHILPEVLATCDRVQIMHQGELLLSDSIAAVNQQMRVSSHLLSFERAPATDALQALLGVVRVELLGDGQWRLHHAPDAPVSSWVAAAVAGSWGLTALVPERRTLEDLFVEIITQDHHLSEAA
ncbi:MAG: ATP-binding cassette domain-containing protein [Gammaproteobacteria bacterium]|nr:ATP-binding cassette domain-containing protein [Gammaproteobacteria bacterium]